MLENSPERLGAGRREGGRRFCGQQGGVLLPIPTPPHGGASETGLKSGSRECWVKLAKLSSLWIPSFPPSEACERHGNPAEGSRTMGRGHGRGPDLRLGGGPWPQLTHSSSRGQHL